MYAIVNGGVVPSGTVRVSGAKNSATRLLAAALLTDEKVELGNFPTALVDVNHKIRFCQNLGAAIDIDADAETLTIDASGLRSLLLTRDQFDVPIRTTYLLTAGQIIRSGIARIPYPGGCPIGGGGGGGRGYDLHMMVWRNLGCTVTEKDDHIEIVGHGFTGADIDFPISTVGGTENALLCGAVAKGRTQIFNAYITPEVNDLIGLLRLMGAKISIRGTSHVVIDGVQNLSGASMDVMPDRIEALTWLTYGILSRGDIKIVGVPFESMEVPLLHIREAGVDYLRNRNSIYITPDALTAGDVQPFELACGTHPGVISDMQAFYVMLGLVASGTSRVFDYRYPERIAFVDELKKLVRGDILSAEKGKITIRGKAQFQPGRANSTDLRGSMAVVMAALCAEGESRIDNVQMALRGYNNLARKLEGLGVAIEVHQD